MAVEEADAGQPVQIDTGEFSMLVGSISFFLTVISQAGPFVNSRLGVPEWVGLSAFAKKDEIPFKLFERALGTQGKRPREIMNSLVRNKLAQMELADGNVTLRITDAGRAKFDEVNLSLKELLSRSLRGMEKSPLALSKGMILVARSLQAGVPQRAKRGKKGKKKRKAAGTPAAA
jgi:hypothetical protein